MIELLKEARELIVNMVQWNKDVEAIIGRVPNTGFQGASDLLARIDVALAAPEPDAMEVCVHCGNTKDKHYKDELLCADMYGSPMFLAKGSAMEILRQVREFSMAVETDDGIGIVWTKQDSEAAALIADFGRRVPSKVLSEYADLYFRDYYLRIDKDRLQKRTMDAILAKYGYRAE